MCLDPTKPAKREVLSFLSLLLLCLWLEKRDFPWNFPFCLVFAETLWLPFCVFWSFRIVAVKSVSYFLYLFSMIFTVVFIGSCSFKSFQNYSMLAANWVTVWSSLTLRRTDFLGGLCTVWLGGCFCMSVVNMCEFVYMVVDAKLPMLCSLPHMLNYQWKTASA